MDRPRRIEIDLLNSAELEPDLLIYSSQQAALFSLNVSARAVWALCDGTRTEDDITRILAADLSLPEAELAPAVHAALVQLREAALIVDSDSAAPPATG